MADRSKLSQEISSVKYLLELKEAECENLKKEKQTIKEEMLNLEKEHYDLKNSFHQMTKIDKNMRFLTEKLDDKEKEIDRLKEELIHKDNLLEEAKRNFEYKYEKDIGLYRIMHENMSHKVEGANFVEKLNQRQHNVILKMEDQISKLVGEEEIRFREREIAHETKLTELKKKMMDHIKETQKSIAEQNLQNLDLNSKLTLLQNHQLLIELEYQSHQIEQLLVTKDSLEKQVFSLKREIEIHKGVEKALAEKNQRFVHALMKFEDESNQDGEKIKPKKDLFRFNDFTETNFHSNLITPNYTKISFNVSSAETKLRKLERTLKAKEQEYNDLKLNYDTIADKLKMIEDKYEGIFNLFEFGLNMLSDELQGSQDLFVNIENIQKADFSALTAEQKYTMVMILIKHLIPIVDPKFLQSDTVKRSLQNVKMRFHFSKGEETFNLTKNKFKDPMKTITEGFRTTKFPRLQTNLNLLHAEAHRTIKRYSIFN